MGLQAIAQRSRREELDFRPLVQARLRRSEFVFEFRVFDGHVFEFAGLEYLATFKALDEFRVFVARHDAHTGVLALCHVASLLGNWGRRDWLHKSGLNSCTSGSGQRRRKVGGILVLVLRLSSLQISSRELRCATEQACSCKVRAGRSMQNRNLASATCMSSADFSQIQTIFVAMVTLSSSAICGGMTFFGTGSLRWLHLPPRVPRIIVAEVLEIKDHEHGSDSPSRAAEQAARSARCR